ncbi:cobalamin B12-binding domain-containing protein [bacterium]|nr:cobalamin B12-binding domain-containing protein [bacterium]
MASKRKILFVHPLGVNWMPGQKDMSRIANIMPPLGLCGLAAWAEQHGHSAHIHDCYAFPGRDEKIDSWIRTEQPDFVGFSTTTSSFLDAARLAERIKAAYPQVRTIVGGVHVSALRESLMRDYPMFDYGVVGEGEEPLLALLEDQDLDNVPGLLLRRGDDVAFTGLQEATLDLDSLPFPAYGALEGFPGAYKLPIFNYPKGPGTTAVSSRGCPYQCSYCDRSVFRRSFRFNSAEYIVELLGHLRGSFGVRHVNFYDDLFTFNRERVVAFCESLLKSNLRMTFNCAARAEHLDQDLLGMLKRAGCWMISLGIESGDADLLKRHRSRADLEMIRERVDWIRGAGIRAKGLFMLGLPGETEETADHSLEYILSLPLDEFNLAKFTPFPGSPLFEEIHQSGSMEDRWDLMNCLNFVYVPEGFTAERLEERFHEFYRSYFQRPRVLLGYLAMVRHSPESWLRFLRNLGDFMGLQRSFRR